MKNYLDAHDIDKTNPPARENWEEKFDKQFADTEIYTGNKKVLLSGFRNFYAALKSFIQSELDAAREEALRPMTKGETEIAKDIDEWFDKKERDKIRQQERQRCIDKLKGMKRHTDPVPFPIDAAFNQAIEEAIKTIEEL